MSAKFRESQISNSNFTETTCVAANFTSARLFDLDFSFANMKHSSFERCTLANARLRHANLYKVDFLDAGIENSDLQDAMSVQDARLSDGTVVRDMNFISNGHAECNSSRMNGWTVQSGNIFTTAFHENTRNDCHFVLHSDSAAATMVQNVNLSTWDSKSWPISRAVLRARFGSGVCIKLRGIYNNNQGCAWQTNSRFYSSSIQSLLLVHLF